MPIFSPRGLVAALIGLYQRTLSPDHGWLRAAFPVGYCRFWPSCSQYARTAVVRHGVIRGLTLAAGRLLRCHPWNPGGIDPVPAERKA